MDDDQYSGIHFSECVIGMELAQKRVLSAKQRKVLKKMYDRRVRDFNALKEGLELCQRADSEIKPIDYLRDSFFRELMFLIDHQSPTTVPFAVRLEKMKEKFSGLYAILSLELPKDIADLDIRHIETKFGIRINEPLSQEEFHAILLKVKQMHRKRDIIIYCAIGTFILAGGLSPVLLAVLH